MKKLLIIIALLSACATTKLHQTESIIGSWTLTETSNRFGTNVSEVEETIEFYPSEYHICMVYSGVCSDFGIWQISVDYLTLASNYGGVRKMKIEKLTDRVMVLNYDETKYLYKK